MTFGFKKQSRRNPRSHLRLALLLAPAIACGLQGVASYNEKYREINICLQNAAASTAGYLNAIVSLHKAVLSDANQRTYSLPMLSLKTDFSVHQHLVELDASQLMIQQIDISDNNGVLQSSSAIFGPDVGSGQETVRTDALQQGQAVVDLEPTSHGVGVIVTAPRHVPANRFDGVIRATMNMSAVTGELRKHQQDVGYEIALAGSGHVVGIFGISRPDQIDVIRRAVEGIDNTRPLVTVADSNSDYVIASTPVGLTALRVVVYTDNRSIVMAWLRSFQFYVLGWLAVTAVIVYSLRLFGRLDSDRQLRVQQLEDTVGRMAAHVAERKRDGEVGSSDARLAVTISIHSRAIQEWMTAIRLSLRHLTRAKRGDCELAHTIAQVTGILEQEERRFSVLSVPDNSPDEPLKAVSVQELLTVLAPLYQELLGRPVSVTADNNVAPALVAPSLLGQAIFCILFDSLNHSPDQRSLKLAIEYTEDRSGVSVSCRVNGGLRSTQSILPNLVDEGAGLGIRAAERLARNAGGKLSMVQSPSQFTTQVIIPFSRRRQDAKPVPPAHGG